MKKYGVLLFDVDGTLLDFDRAEEMGIEGLLEHYGVPVTAENKEKYHHLNKSYWERLDVLWLPPHIVRHTLRSFP